MATQKSAALAALLTLAATAGGQIRPEPRRPHQRPVLRHRPAIQTEYTKVTGRVVDGVCETTIAMRFRNNGASIGEKVVCLPLPKGAIADKLEMIVEGKAVTGEVLANKKARRIYESIVSRRRDPGLLEYLDHDLVRLRVFPIPAKGTQDVSVRFRLVLPENAGMHRYEFPTRALEGGLFSLDLKIDSKKAIKNVWSPMQGMDVSRKNDHQARVSYECRGKPRRDPIVFYGLSERDFGLNLLTYRKGGGQKDDGYCLMMLAPKRDWRHETELKKTITFVLDTSGSMRGQKIEQAKSALKFFLRSLRPSDHFNVVPFSTEARPFAETAVAGTGDKIGAALKFADEIRAKGGTNIGEALSFALASRPVEGSVPIVVFLTDGLPTVGVTAANDLLKMCAANNQSNARVFVFGVGNDVNTYLLDQLSSKTRGTRDYVRPGENLEVKVSALFEMLAHPVMTDVEIVCDVGLNRIVPKKLPDMFRGGRLVIAGRYRGTGAVAIRLRGKVGSEIKEFVYDASFPEASTEHDFVATMWAQRRVALLLDQIRQHGHQQSSELISEIRRIGAKHGIVTPYTSHLIVEESERLARGWARGQVGASGSGGPATPGGAKAAARIRRELAHAGITTDTGSRPPAAEKDAGRVRWRGVVHGKKSGPDAVRASTITARLLYLDALDEGKGTKRVWTTQRIGGRQFHFVNGVWIDSTYKRAMENSLRKVKAFSPEYFELLRKHTKLGKVLAFSTAMVVVVGKGEAVEITP